jgi:hypothetical protein
MAETATAEYYRKQNDLNKAKLKTDYEQYLADLATKYGISQDQLNSNLESRGILRSGEAGTAQARLGAANEAARTSATTNYDYNVASEDVNLATQLAGLQSAAPAAPAAPAKPATPATPATTTVDYSGVDFNALGRWMAQIEKDKKDKAQIAAAPGYDWNKLAGFGGGTGATNKPAPATTRPGRGAR